MNDILSAQCTVITFISILFGLWYSDICKSLSEDIKKQSDAHKIKDIKNILYTKIIVLVISTTFNILFFLKPIWQILISCYWYLLNPHRLNLIEAFDPINASVFFVFLLSVYICCVCYRWFIVAIKKIKTKL